jgi:hypothetical protein
MATTDGAFRICGALLVAGESFEAGVACAFGALWLLLCQICFLDEAAAMASAVLVLATAGALVLAELAHEALLAVANRLKLIVHGALTMARAQVLAFVAWAKEITLAAEEARLALASCNAFLGQSAVALASANFDHSSLALTTGARHGAVFAKEPGEASAVSGLGWSVAAPHEQACFEVECGVIIERLFAAACRAFALVALLARKQAVA